MDQSPSQSNATQPTYQPGIADILAVKNLFYETSSPLPIELVDVIMDMAEYWAHSSVTLRWSDTVPGLRRDGGGSTEEEVENKMYMRMPPLGMYYCPEDDLILERQKYGYNTTLADLEGLDGIRQLFGESASSDERKKKEWANPRGEHPCRKIVFDISSHDQGKSVSL